jgi:hypothetical protein
LAEDQQGERRPRDTEEIEAVEAELAPDDGGGSAGAVADGAGAPADATGGSVAPTADAPTSGPASDGTGVPARTDEGTGAPASLEEAELGSPTAGPASTVGAGWRPTLGDGVPPTPNATVPASRKASREAARSRRTTWFGVGGVAVVAVVLGAVVWLVARGDGEATEALSVATVPVGVTVTADPPTPTITPSRRPAATPFAQALPTEVGAFALVASEIDDAWSVLGAVEAYTLTYSDGASEVTVQAGQWLTPVAAAAALAAIEAEEPAQTGASPGGSATAEPVGDRIAWANETAVFTVAAPGGAAVAFEAQFPM